MKLFEIRNALLARNFECRSIKVQDGTYFFKPTAETTIMIAEETSDVVHLARPIQGGVVLVAQFDNDSKLLDNLQYAILNYEEVSQVELKPETIPMPLLRDMGKVKSQYN